MGKTKDEIDLEPDAWQRFERAVDVVAKSPPQHRENIKKSSSKIKKKNQTSKR